MIQKGAGVLYFATEADMHAFTPTYSEIAQTIDTKKLYTWDGAAWVRDCCISIVDNGNNTVTLTDDIGNTFCLMMCPPTPTLGSNFDNEVLIGHFNISSFLNLFDGNTTQATTTNISAHRLHQGDTISFDLISPYSATDSLQLYWSNIQQPGNAANEILGIEILISNDGGTTTTSFFTPTEFLPVTGDQVFDFTPGTNFNWIGIRSILSDNVGQDPYLWEITVSNIPN